MSGERRGRAWAPVNIALVKHWGLRRGDALAPARASLSLTLEHGVTTRVELSPAIPGDSLVVAGVPLDRASGEKAAAALDLVDAVRRAAGLEGHGARIESAPEVPVGSGMASSAAGGAALTLALLEAAGLLGDATEAELLRWCSRAGSLSALRSLRGGAVRLDVGRDGHLSLAEVPLGLDLSVLSCVVSEEPKAVSSSAGHVAARTSPFWDAFERSCRGVLAEVEAALRGGDLSRLGAAVEADALAMHAVMLTSRPSIVYGADATWAVWREVASAREGGLEAWCTLDAGPSPHVLCASSDAERLAARLEAVAGVRRVLRSPVCPWGAQVIGSDGPAPPRRSCS